MDKNYILSPEAASRKLRRMAYEILENNFAEKEIILAGIRVNGSVIARNIQALLKEISTDLIFVLYSFYFLKLIYFYLFISINKTQASAIAFIS